MSSGCAARDCCKLRAVKEIPDEPLRYAKPPAWYHRRAWRRGLWAGVVLLVAGSGFWWGPPAKNHVELLYWQHRCLNYEAPAGTAVFQVSGDGVVSVETVPRAWAELYGQATGQLAVLFMHGRRASNGETRLVVVQYLPAEHSVAYARSFTVDRIRGPREQSSIQQLALPKGRPVTMAAGQVDPSDESHFTIEFEVMGTPGIIDGWLREDGTVVMELRKQD
jgi:hypothetical protein